MRFALFLNDCSSNALRIYEKRYFSIDIFATMTSNWRWRQLFVTKRRRRYYTYKLFSAVFGFVYTAREMLVFFSASREMPRGKRNTGLLHRIGLPMVFVMLIPVSFSIAQQKPETSSPSDVSSSRATDFFPLEITPEGVLVLQGAESPSFELINADKISSSAEMPPSEPRRIYYTTGISIRAAREAVLRDRRQQGNRITPSVQPSQRLIGTPLDWKSLGLPVDREAFREKGRAITPRALSEAIKDGVDMQVIDLRPRPPRPPRPPDNAATASEISPFPQALNLFPHQLNEAVAEFSRNRWLVLIDDGDGMAKQLAEQLFHQGFFLAGFLEGGYPAWVAATDR